MSSIVTAPLQISKGFEMKQPPLRRELSSPMLPREQKRMVELMEVTSQSVEVCQGGRVMVLVLPDGLRGLIQKKRGRHCGGKQLESVAHWVRGTI
eukprot:CAMPEP_0182804524 /NCGR_PEP_ID=MMETSP0006_2-20121128/4592_1 /TAXON_ID=97485 /ORGANISM="Prymnesium parvum, Strain Texoma1" /LENGTH=94 /DNA_ID=CAMNT_0024930039 /DNA_START=933 /DNA_END=1217 /DNA_ORIENTATION=-